MHSNPYAYELHGTYFDSGGLYHPINLIVKGFLKIFVSYPNPGRRSAFPVHAVAF